LASWGPHDKRNRTGRYAPVQHPPPPTNGQPTLFSNTNEGDGADNPGFQPDDGGVTTDTNAGGHVEMQTF